MKTLIPALMILAVVPAMAKAPDKLDCEVLSCHSPSAQTQFLCDEYKGPFKFQFDYNGSMGAPAQLSTLNRRTGEIEVFEGKHTYGSEMMLNLPLPNRQKIQIQGNYGDSGLWTGFLKIGTVSEPARHEWDYDRYSFNATALVLKCK